MNNYRKRRSGPWTATLGNSRRAAQPARRGGNGAGFGGLSVAKGLAGKPFDVTVVDRHNYHLFQPLLYQVATAGLSPADIASPIRGILRGAENITVVLAKVSGIDVAAQAVIAEGRRIGFDYLIDRDRRRARLFRP